MPHHRSHHRRRQRSRRPLHCLQSKLRSGPFNAASRSKMLAIDEHPPGPYPQPRSEWIQRIYVSAALARSNASSSSFRQCRRARVRWRRSRGFSVGLAPVPPVCSSAPRDNRAEMALHTTYRPGTSTTPQKVPTTMPPALALLDDQDGVLAQEADEQIHGGAPRFSGSSCQIRQKTRRRCRVRRSATVDAPSRRLS